VPVEWLRESEIKHGRVCMLATLGYIAQDCGVRLPGEIHQVSSLKAHDAAVGYGGMAQIFGFLFLFEIISYFAIVEMLEGSGRKPGDYGEQLAGAARYDRAPCAGASRRERDTVRICFARGGGVA